MATVPHLSAPCEPLTTLMAACFGDQSTPASLLPASNPTAETHWQDAVTQVGEQLRAKLRVEVLPDRLHKALALVLAHAVTLHPDDIASVQSGKQTYRLAPDCPCAAATHRAELCQHTLAVELHRRALALLDSTAPASGPTAARAPVSAPPPNAEAPPAAASPAAEDTRQERLPSADRWEVTEAPASCCLRLRIGEIELMYTMRDVSDAELTSRVQHLVPWVQDVLDQARERQALLDTLRQQRKAVSAGPTAVPQMPPSAPPADLQALIQQAVQQALAAQQPPSNSQTLANSQVSEAETPAVPEGWCDLHHIAMERRSNARGSWWSHWIAREQRYCKGKASRRPQTFPRPGGARPRPTRGGAQMTTTTPGIQVGSLALATRASGVCDVGERGVCFEVYTLGGRPGFSFLFEQGRYDGFSPEDVAMFLMITGEVCAAVADYRFTNVIRLQRDWAQGRFAAAFPPQPSPLPRTGPANATSTARGS